MTLSYTYSMPIEGQRTSHLHYCNGLWLHTGAKWRSTELSESGTAAQCFSNQSSGTFKQSTLPPRAGGGAKTWTIWRSPGTGLRNTAVAYITSDSWADSPAWPGRWCWAEWGRTSDTRSRWNSPRTTPCTDTGSSGCTSAVGGLWVHIPHIGAGSMGETSMHTDTHPRERTHTNTEEHASISDAHWSSQKRKQVLPIPFYYLPHPKKLDYLLHLMGEPHYES